jgi:hypothetical protein
MRVACLAVAFASLLFIAGPSHALQSKHDPLTQSEIEEVRESTDLPPVRVKLYMRFLDERAAKIVELNKSELVEHRGIKLHDMIEQFTAITDELQNNLDEYQSYETDKRRPVPDLRKVLPLLQKSESTWQATFAGLPANEDYGFVLETNNEAQESLRQQTAELIASQEKYFAEKKKEDKQKARQAEGGYVLP